MDQETPSSVAASPTGPADASAGAVTAGRDTDSGGFVETTTEASTEELADAVTDVVTEPVTHSAEEEKDTVSKKPAETCTETSGASGPTDTVDKPSEGAESDVDDAAEGPRTPIKTANEENKGKVSLLLKAVGDAPIMKQRLWMVEPDKPVTWVVQFIRRFIRLPPSEALFVFVSSAFSPAPDQTIGNLFHCFGSEGRLVLHYCKAQAWG